MYQEQIVFKTILFTRASKIMFKNNRHMTLLYRTQKVMREIKEHVNKNTCTI